MRTSLYIALPLMLVLGLAQAVVMPRLPVLGMTPQLLVLATIAWSLLRGINEGLVWAFVAGLSLDLFSAAPLGLSSLALLGGVLAIGLLQRAFPRSRFFLTAVLAALATLIYLLLYLLLLLLFGYPVSGPAAASLPPLALLHGLLILPVYWLLGRIDHVFRPRRVEL